MKKVVAVLVPLLAVIMVSGACPQPTAAPTTTPALRPAEFTVSDLAISPHEVEASEDSTVTVRVENIGELEGTKTITLRIDGVEVESKNITLAGGETETVSFTIVKETEGTYNIEVEGLTTTLTVLQTQPPDWTQYAAHDFVISLPADWMALEILPETIDAVIDELGPTNPELVPFLEALKNQGAIGFFAIDMASPPGYIVNLNVTREIRLIQSLDDYADFLKTQFEPVGWTLFIGDKFSLKGYDAIRLETSYTVHYPSGEPFQGEQQVVIVDHATDRYMITLSHSAEDSQKYKELFDLIVQTFDIVK